MQDDERLAQQFEEHRPLLRAVAYRMLGSLTDAEDAIQNAWLRFNQTDTDTIDNLSGWLTTVIGRECLHLLRAGRRRREDLLDPVTQLPDPIVTTVEDDPEQQAVRADSVSLALLVVLDSLNPAERLAFVLHDIFDVPFDEIAPLVEHTPAATRQLASRARRRVRDHRPPMPDRDPGRQREVVEAFYAAVNAGNFAALLEMLAPDAVFHADNGPDRPSKAYRGAETIARQSHAARGADLQPVMVNGLPGVVAFRDERPISLMAFTVVAGRIVALYGIRDPERVLRLTAGIIRSGH
ncbi:RNA polymerase sigma factor SigJ [Arthrobacter sp. VKM Ac-2550]|uniref:RNA polymerase sigma factor SigJ n=1 Tax=Crystallibacter permensis TaxID=1938888 RepID=UPI002227DAA1|nr:RNA polymerase sigma factor SigJ [Arthrobacter sp. VKM Ac-2550]MCW2131928.1 RNA polymerase sigma-70 factor, ECF subfamily [Arthrobacter sp. VKM Ac-2550]